MYQRRRNLLCKGLEQAGWLVEPPKGTMLYGLLFQRVSADSESLEFTKVLLEKALVAMSPGVDLGPMGDGNVRFALIENDHRTRQALRG